MGPKARNWKHRLKTGDGYHEQTVSEGGREVLWKKSCFLEANGQDESSIKLVENSCSATENACIWQWLQEGKVYFSSSFSDLSPQLVFSSIDVSVVRQTHGHMTVWSRKLPQSSQAPEQECLPMDFFLPLLVFCTDPQRAGGWCLHLGPSPLSLWKHHHRHSQKWALLIPSHISIQLSQHSIFIIISTS